MIRRLVELVTMRLLIDLWQRRHNVDIRDKLMMNPLASRGVTCLVVQSEIIATKFQAKCGLHQLVVSNAHLALVSSTSNQVRQKVIFGVGRRVDQKNHASLLGAWSLNFSNHPR